MHRKTHNMKMGIGSIWLARSQLEQIQKKLCVIFHKITYTQNFIAFKINVSFSWYNYYSFGPNTLNSNLTKKEKITKQQHQRIKKL